MNETIDSKVTRIRAIYEELAECDWPENATNEDVLIKLLDEWAEFIIEFGRPRDAT
tara:strand:- start:274 stop:441 length:168 start_codon:yes stop_codon:yes gene_type:complete